MNFELTEAALLRALELHTQNPAPREALAWEVQRVNDIAADIRQRLLSMLGSDDPIIRSLNTLMLPEELQEKKKKPKIEPCPFCQCELIEAPFPTRWEHPDNDCIMPKSLRLMESDLPGWNMCGRSKAREVFNMKGCSQCHSATPQSFSRICGDRKCPHKKQEK